MLEDHTGQRVPDASFHLIDDGLKVRTTADLFAGRTVALFSLPGAFTPTCSSSHVPRFQELSGLIAAQGVDEIVCVSVNDAFVMDAWAQDQGAPNVTFLADGNGTFTEGMGLLVEKQSLGFGKRSWRYSMVVKDGVIDKMFIEPDVPGDPYEVSDADTMLNYLAPDQKVHDIVLFTKKGCAHCAKAKAALADAGLPYSDVPATPAVLRALSDTPTTPRVFVDGKLLGGAEELIAFIG